MNTCPANVRILVAMDWFDLARYPALWDLSPLVRVFGTLGPGIAVCVALGFFVGIVSSMFGVGGGFVITPFFHSVLAVPASFAVSSSMGQIALTSGSGISEYIRKRKIRYAYAGALLCGSIPASQAMAHFLAGLPASALAQEPVLGTLSWADLILLCAFGFILGAIGILNVRRALRPPQSTGVAGPGSVLPLSARRAVELFGVGALFGLFSALLGIGGGFFAVPYFVYVCRFEPVEAVATSYLCILVTSTLAALYYVAQGHLYLLLALFLALGSVFGAQLGARLAIKLAPNRLLLIIGVTQIAVVLTYVGLKLT